MRCRFFGMETIMNVIVTVDENWAIGNRDRHISFSSTLL